MDLRANSFRQAFFSLLDYEANGQCKPMKETILAPGHRWIPHVAGPKMRRRRTNRGMRLSGFFSGND